MAGNGIPLLISLAFLGLALVLHSPKGFFPKIQEKGDYKYNLGLRACE